MSTAKAGSAADAPEKRKITKYEDIGSQFEFCPVGLETLGPWSPSATALFEAVGRKMAEVTGEPRADDGQRKGTQQISDDQLAQAVVDVILALGGRRLFGKSNSK
ncbi:hypothetical protein RvY_17314 [Ramazzottius varieornatus]|uniref:Uncharacterized protein n=1 Tax=Ramazzottius varieornatus TaxID=947166 RepID=A0A1D1W1Q9_RAMVA|nr:hypothetical protein RvY_17314 [Ramazzottius varieornatus]